MDNGPPISGHAAACLMLADGTTFFGEGFGAADVAIGEICFNTGMTGYQETLTDPSFAGQIIVFTFPHIGNTGCNSEDMEAQKPAARGLVARERPTPPSNFRSQTAFDVWLKEQGIAGISGVDTRALTRCVRTKGAQNAAVFRFERSAFERQTKEILARLAAHPVMEGLELASGVCAQAPYAWSQTVWRLPPASRTPNPEAYHVVAIDYGQKRNILRCLAERGCRVTVVPARTGAEEILALKPDGVFLSNGPGDPAATGAYAVPALQTLIARGIPMFGICLGHQLLALAAGAETRKMRIGHRGANQPVKNLETGKVEITSQNHGFCVLPETLPGNARVTHLSLFDGSLEGFRLADKPVFAVQYHPEASPGPHDSGYLFDRFVEMMKSARQNARSSAA